MEQKESRSNDDRLMTLLSNYQHRPRKGNTDQFTENLAIGA